MKNKQGIKMVLAKMDNLFVEIGKANETLATIDEDGETENFCRDLHATYVNWRSAIATTLRKLK